MESDAEIRAICLECSGPFSISLEEQRFYTDRTLRLPSYCPGCRAGARQLRNASLIAQFETRLTSATWQDGGEGYGVTSTRPRNGKRPGAMATCATCGAESWIPFTPRHGRAVYCRECLNARKGT